MKIRTWCSFLKQGVKNAFGNKTMSVASIVAITAALCVLGVVMLIVLNLNYLMDDLESKLEVTVFLEKDVKDSDIKSIEKTIKSWEGVNEIEFVSKASALTKWKEELGEDYLAGVENSSSRTHLKTGLKQEDYFNSGLLFMNLKKWREDNLSKKIINFKENNPDKISTNDQCAINCVVNKRWKRLPLKWNHQTGMYRNKSIKKRYSDDELKEALNNPSVIHFIGIDKPWNKYCYHPWQKEYIETSKELGLAIETATELEFFIKSLLSFSSIKKYIRSRYRLFQLANRG